MVCEDISTVSAILSVAFTFFKFLRFSYIHINKYECCKFFEIFLLRAYEYIKTN